jgi:hypothetical protein
MTITHRLTGYDKVTERLILSHVIPKRKVPVARQLAGVAPEDRDAVGVYPLQHAQAERLAQELGETVDTDRYDWCLEPMPQTLSATGG